jgi:hypothetical protein
MPPPRNQERLRYHNSALTPSDEMEGVIVNAREIIFMAT